MNSPVNFLLPVKSLAQAKQRLAKVLTVKQRSELALSLLQRNLTLLVNRFAEHNILIITPDLTVAAMATSYGANVLMEESATGLNAAVEAGTRWSLEQGFKAQVVIAPDIAFLDEAELKQLLREAQKPQIVGICVAKDRGTNALLTSPPDAIPFYYGEQSAKWMALAAQRRGIPCRSMRLPCLSLDIDTPNDLALYQASKSSFFETYTS